MSRCTSLPIPSAITVSPSVLAIRTMTSARASRCVDTVIPSTKDLSILSTSIGSSRR
jgi:hypothetical protein